VTCFKIYSEIEIHKNLNVICKLQISRQNYSVTQDTLNLASVCVSADLLLPQQYFTQTHKL